MAIENTDLLYVQRPEGDDAGAYKIEYEDLKDAIVAEAGVGDLQAVTDNGSDTSNGATFGGQVGIGTTDVDGQLEVRSNASLGIISRAINTQSTDGNKALKVRNNSDTDTFNVSYRGAGYFASDVGIGTNVPLSRCDVVKSGTAGDLLTYRQIRIGNDTNADYSGYLSYANLSGKWCTVIESLDNKNASNVVLAPSGGNVGISVTNPLTKLDIIGAVRSRRVAIANDTAFDIRSSNVYTAGAVQINNPTNTADAIGMSGVILMSADPTWQNSWKHPGGTWTAPSAFPAIVPFFVQATNTILVGNPTEGIA